MASTLMSALVPVVVENLQGQMLFNFPIQCDILQLKTVERTASQWEEDNVETGKQMLLFERGWNVYMGSLCNLLHCSQKDYFFRQNSGSVFCPTPSVYFAAFEKGAK